MIVMPSPTSTPEAAAVRVIPSKVYTEGLAGAPLAVVAVFCAVFVLVGLLFVTDAVPVLVSRDWVSREPVELRVPELELRARGE